MKRLAAITFEKCAMKIDCFQLSEIVGYKFPNVISLQGGKDPQNVSSCTSLSSNEPTT